MLFCTYLTVYSGNILPPFYIGSSSVVKVEAGYHGSVASSRYKEIWKRELSMHPHLFITKILTTHTSRDKALERELLFQQQLQVTKSPLYVNEGYALVGGGGSGVDHWSKQPGKIHNAKSNHPRGMLGKKHSDETKARMATSRSGPKNHFFGKHHTEETRNKIKDRRQSSNLGWITDGSSSKWGCKSDPIPDGWQRGRTLHHNSDRKGKQWINNQSIEQYVGDRVSIPEGWAKGRLKRTSPKSSLLPQGELSCLGHS